MTRTKLKNSVIDQVGNTPLMEIPHKKSDKVKLYAKLEWFNPSGSVKDRAAKAIFIDALKKDQLTNKILCDATSGNTGISYAMLGAYFSIPVELALPRNASEERKLLLRNYGAEVVLTDPLQGTDGAQRFVQHLIKKNPDKYFCPDQYNNENNWKAHYETTGPEIWAQTDQKVTHYIAGLGTTGTFVGTSRFLKEKGVTCVAVQPDNPMHGLEGWKHLETAIVPGIFDNTVADENVEITTEEGFSFARAATIHLGIHISPSSGANLAAAMKLVEQLDSGCVVTICPDNAMKYLNDPFWSDDDYLIKDPFV